MDSVVSVHITVDDPRPLDDRAHQKKLKVYKETRPTVLGSPEKRVWKEKRIETKDAIFKTTVTKTWKLFL